MGPKVKMYLRPMNTGVAAFAAYFCTLFVIDAQAAVLLGPGDQARAEFEIPVVTRSDGTQILPPFDDGGFLIEFNDRSGVLPDDFILEGENALIQLFDADGTLNTSLDIRQVSDDNEIIGTSFPWDFDQLFTSSTGSIVISSIGNSSFVLGNVVITFTPFMGSGQTDVFITEFAVSSVSDVPVPSALILFVPGLLGLFAATKNKIVS